MRFLRLRNDPFISSVKQTTFKKMPDLYYFDGDCANANISLAMKRNAASQFRGYVQGKLFKVNKLLSANGFNFLYF